MTAHPEAEAKLDRALETTIRALLAERQARQPGSTICPSDAARAIGGDRWRELMEPARRAAQRMVARGEIEITQKGQVVDPHAFRGPIRLRLRQPRPVKDRS
jgi:hypothetical protein